jgi:hypothetical protein
MNDEAAEDPRETSQLVRARRVLRIQVLTKKPDVMPWIERAVLREEPIPVEDEQHQRCAGDERRGDGDLSRAYGGRG